MSNTANLPVIKGTLVSTAKYTWNTADSLGRGASAIVYLGRHRNQGTLVAVKVFHDYVSMGRKQDDARELELLRRLEHPNIIKLLDIETVPQTSRQVIVMEYCEGYSVHHMLDQPLYFYGLTEEEFLLVLSHVSAGMRYLREQNVIHRDIKPGNIMRYVTTEGFSVYKLTDFGAARDLDDDESFQSLYGTEEYLHPGIYERAVLKLPTVQSFDAKVDLWSLGVTFYHTATGQLPFQAFGGRSNRQKMFEIISQKESGVISGIQTIQGGPISWRSDLPDSSPLSSGLRAVVIPLLAGLMEPDENKMITYESLFRIVQNIEKKITISVFHFYKCEDLIIYVDPSITFTGLQDEIASMTDLRASDQILLIGGKLLEEVVDPLAELRDYPPHIMADSIYLFPREINDGARIMRPEIPLFPEFVPYSDVEQDSRLAQSCCARGELIKRYTLRCAGQQDRLLDGLFCYRVYVESRLLSTKSSQDLMKQLMDECDCHHKAFFEMAQILHDTVMSRDRGHRDVGMLENVLSDNTIKQVHSKACDRITEIDQYRDALIKKLDEIKTYANKISLTCTKEKCPKKIKHYMSVISGVQSRFRRDKSVRHQMTQHDENIHGFERQKLREHCETMKSAISGHCLPRLEQIFRNCIHIVDSLTRCLGRVQKIEKNINSVVNCQKLLSERLIKLRYSCHADLRFVRDSGFGSSGSGSSGARVYSMETGESGDPNVKMKAGTGYITEHIMPMSGVEEGLQGAFGGGIGIRGSASSSLKRNLEGSDSMAGDMKDLNDKLQYLQSLLNENSRLLQSSLEATPLQSGGSLTTHLNARRGDV